MSCDLGDGNPFRVETDNLPSKFALCDNKWHNVSAMYDSEQIALRIDNQASTTTLAQHRMSGKVHTKSPLYIGGLPGKFYKLIDFYDDMMLKNNLESTILKRK